MSGIILPRLELKDAAIGTLSHKTGGFDLKELEDDGTFEGYASVFGEVDEGGDIVVKGAFKKSLKAGIKPKMLYQHNPDQPIGVWPEVREDEKGLFVKGKLVRESQRGAECYALLKAGALDGMSIGYRTIRAERDERTGIRTLKEVELWEISIVTFPMNTSARVSGVKRTWTERTIERLLREGGLPIELAKSVVLHGAKRALELSGHPRDAEGGQLSELLASVKRVTHDLEKLK